MRFFVAFFISLLIYVLLTWFFMTQFPSIKMPPKKMNDKVIKIDILNIPKPMVKEVETKVNVKTTEQKTVVKKKVVKKRAVKKKLTKKKKVIKKKHVQKKKYVKKKVKPKAKKKIVVEEPIIEEEIVENVPDEMVYIEEPFITKPVEVKKSSDDLSSFLSTSTPSVSAASSNSYPTPKIKKLYGSSFHTFTPSQKEFIENNLDVIQSITQELLTRRGYPEGAGRNRQEGTNVVTFNLHPNGDISNLRLKQRIGSRPLDDNTLSLIRSAYKDYPYPTTTTKIVFYVTYSIYGY